MNQEPPRSIEEAVKQQQKAFQQKQLQQSIQQLAIFVIFAFINYLLIDFNLSWLFGVQVTPLYATILSFVFVRWGIPLAVLGYALETSGVIFPIFQLGIS
jgi:hypothetical protein